MKTLSRFLLCFFLFSGVISLRAQEKPDVVTMRNGEKKSGKVKAIKGQLFAETADFQAERWEFTIRYQQGNLKNAGTELLSIVSINASFNLCTNAKKAAHN